jgi:hypothetical protein
MDQQIVPIHGSIAANGSTWNEVNNRPLSYSWQHSDLGDRLSPDHGANQQGTCHDKQNQMKDARIFHQNIMEKTDQLAGN